MDYRLKRLLESLDPDRVLDETAARADRAINSFRTDGAAITDWDRFQQCMSRFCRHVEATVLRLNDRIDVSEEFYCGRCSHFLTAAFGRSGEQAAFEMARTGNEGGLYAVLKAVAQAMLREYGSNEISGRVLSFWNGLSSDEQLAAAQEYIEEYGHLLPSELTEGSAARLKGNFVRVLEEHPRLMRRLRQVGRK
jgi:hypothetical protein